MRELVFSDNELCSHRTVLKRVTNTGARWHVKHGHNKQRNYFAQSEDGSQYQIYQRQNLDDTRDFSCGLA